MADKKKLVRSVLFRMPRVYTAATSQARYRLLRRLRIVHEADFKLLPSLLDRPDPMVLDVGANIGQSILSLMTVLPAANVMSFEPNPDNLPALTKLADVFPSVSVYNFGLGAREESLDLYWPVYNGKPMTALASCDKAEAAEWLGPHRMYGFDSKRLELRSTVVLIRRLDALNVRPDVVKIDVQGLEDDVIEGGLRTIEQCEPLILAESVSPGSRAHDLVRPFGYTLHRRPGSVNTWLLPPGRSIPVS